VDCCHREASTVYLASKHSLSEFDMDHITWPVLHSYMAKQPMVGRAVTAKFIHGWLPTIKHFLNRQNRESNPTCPVCEGADETMQHMLTCFNAEAYQHRIGLVRTCVELLLKHHTWPQR
jgi:hypothetical protein